MVSNSIIDLEPGGQLHVYKATFFASVHPEQMKESLKAFGFTPVKHGIRLIIDGVELTIIPLRNQREGKSQFGYRAYYTGSCDSLPYLFDMILGVYEPSINGIEVMRKQEGMDQNKWIKACRKLANPLEIRGLFTLRTLQIACLPDDTVNLQYRGKKMGIKDITPKLREIDGLIKELNPAKPFDLFSFMPGEEAV